MRSSACARRTCEGNPRIDGRTDRAESFVTSLWRFNVKVVVDDDDFEFLSHEMRSKFAIVVIRPSVRPRPRPSVCFCAIVLGNPMRHFRRRSFMRTRAHWLIVRTSMPCHGYGIHCRGHVYGASSTCLKMLQICDDYLT